MQIISLLLSLLLCVFARAISKIRPSGKECYVIGSNYGSMPDPNAVAMVNYLLGEGLSVVYVGEYQAKNGVTVFERGSFSAAKVFLNAKAVFYTHSLSDVLPVGHKLSAFKSVLQFPPAVFLQHGVIGLKSSLSSGVSMKSYIMSLAPTFDHMVVSSERERGIVDAMGVPKHKIALTGLPRFDAYSRSPVQTPTKLLVFFTWQDKSQLHHKINAVCNVLASHDVATQYEICIGSHQMQGVDLRFESNFESFTMVKTEDLQSVVTDCALLITDDSSMCWDVIYLGGDVQLYKPSTNWLLSDVGLEARISHSEDDFAQNIQTWLNGDLAPLEPFTRYTDHSNASRVFQLVSEKGD